MDGPRRIRQVARVSTVDAAGKQNQQHTGRASEDGCDGSGCRRWCDNLVDVVMRTTAGSKPFQALATPKQEKS